MRLLLQKVSQARVTVDNNVVGSIGQGYLVLLGVMEGDTDEQAVALANKVAALRLFTGPDDKINDLSLVDVHGEALVVSQFTLAGSTAKGNRPDYTAAADPAEAERLYDVFITALRSQPVARVETGQFGAMMQVSLVNEGPVTLLLEK